MISFNEKDENMGRIKEAAKVENYVSNLNYRVYGLREDLQENFPLMITMRNTDPEKIAPLKKFFELNGLPVEIENNDNEKIYLGMRLDVRKHIPLAAAIVQTVVYFFEGKLTLEKAEKIDGLPVFPEIFAAA